MKKNNVFSMLSWFEAQKVNDAKVLVVGAGALGNEVLKNLALFGVGHIVIVDFDTIEHSNLTRSVLFRADDADKKLPKAVVAAQRIKEINPAIHVIPITEQVETGLGLGLFRRMDVVIGCLDNLPSRIFLNRLCFRAGKTWIDGAIGDLEGQASVYQPGKSCYECNLTEEEKSDFDKRISCAGIVKMNENAGRVATTPVSASIVAAVQVQEALKIIHQKESPVQTLAGKLFVYEGMVPAVGIYEFNAFDNHCLAHEYWTPVIEIPELSAETPVAQAIEIIKKILAVESLEINLRNDRFVDRLVSRSGNKICSPMLPASKIPAFIRSNEELHFIQVAEGFYQHDFENINETFPSPHLTLRQIGIPPLDVLQVSTPQGLFYVELSQDINQYEALTSIC